MGKQYEWVITMEDVEIVLPEDCFAVLSQVEDSVKLNKPVKLDKAWWLKHPNTGEGTCWIEIVFQGDNQQFSILDYRDLDKL